jgi:hypothetical protein
LWSLVPISRVARCLLLGCWAARDRCSREGKRVKAAGLIITRTALRAASTGRDLGYSGRIGTAHAATGRAEFAWCRRVRWSGRKGIGRGHGAEQKATLDGS